MLSAIMKDNAMDDNEVGEDGLCPLTKQPCKCIPRSLGHWCCWSVPRTPMEAYRATMRLPPPEESTDE